MLTMCKMFLPLALLLFVSHQIGVNAQLTITVTTWNSANPGSPNTFIGKDNEIASSLLASGTPALMWGVVSSNDVNAVCQQNVNTGSLTFTATIVATTGTTDTLSMTITAIGGCLAASDGSGTQAVLVDNNGRQSAVVCPNDAGSKGCGVYLTGEDVNSIYNQGPNRRRLLSSRRLLQSECQTEAQKGAITGAITGVLTVGGCLGLGPLAPFCVAGVLGANAALGAAAGCAAGAASAGCFPGDATVLLATGETKYMTALVLGDTVAVRTHDGAIDYEEIYAFGHKDASASANYIQISMKPSGGNLSDPALETRVLELTAGHFAQVSSGLSGKISYKRGKDIAVGDLMCAQSTQSETSTSSYVVTRISTLQKKGLYNPFTLSGTIMVNGVAASTHSDWFLDTTFDSLNIAHKLPSAYQTVLSPVRTLYYALGGKTYIALYNQLDGLIDVATFGTKYGGYLVSIMATSSIAVAVLIPKMTSATTA